MGGRDYLDRPRLKEISLETKEKSIDEKLAEANAEFDKRLADEGVIKKPGERIVAKPAKAVIRPKVQSKRVGDVAHVHYDELDYEIVERDCLYVEHFVNDRKGFRINNVRFQGKVVVPLCVANYLSKMENDNHAAERGIFENRGRRLNYGEVSG